MNDILETRNPNSCFIELLPKCDSKVIGLAKWNLTL